MVSDMTIFSEVVSSAVLILVLMEYGLWPPLAGSVNNFLQKS